MKPEDMILPDMERMYNHRYQYEQHKKKLMKIYENRISDLRYDNHRATHFQHIKQSKIKNFIHKYNQKSSSIARQNLKLLSKLENIKTSMNFAPSSQHQRNKSHSFLTPLAKKKIKQTQTQNSRIYQKVKNISSSLSQKNFIRDFSKSQQIKSRIMKYMVNDNSRVLLKSQRYLQTDGSQTSLSKLKNIKQKLVLSSEPRKLKILTQSSIRKTSNNHYRREDILKNRVDTSTSSLAAIKAKVLSKQKKLKIENAQNLDQKQEKTGNFFTTQPNKQKRIGKKRVYLA